MNPYDILGVPHGSTKEICRAAYRKLAMRHHPDRGGSEAKFKEVKSAWESIEGGSTQTAQATQQTYQRTWTKPEDAWSGYSTFTKPKSTSSQYRQQARTTKPTVVEAHRSPHFPAGDFIARVSLQEAYRGFTAEVSLNGSTYQIAIPAGVPDGLRFRGQINDFEHVIIQIKYTQSTFVPIPLEKAITKTTVIDGREQRVLRTGELHLQVEVPVKNLEKSNPTIDVYDFLGEKITVKGPDLRYSLYDRQLKPIIVRFEGKGYVDWLPDLKRGTDQRADLVVHIIPTEMEFISTFY